MEILRQEGVLRKDESEHLLRQGEGEPVSRSGHTSCWQLPSQAPRYPDGRGRICAAHSILLQAPAVSINLQSPRKAPLASSLLPLLFVALVPL